MERAEIEHLLDSGHEPAMIEAILSAALFDPDWQWAQNLCLRYLNHRFKWVRWNAVTGFSHIARIHGQLDTNVVIPRLSALKDDPDIGPNVRDSLDDIPFFLRKHTQ